MDERFLLVQQPPVPNSNCARSVGGDVTRRSDVKKWLCLLTAIAATMLTVTMAAIAARSG